MNKISRIVLLAVALMTTGPVNAEQDLKDFGAPPESITLERFSMDRVADARAHYLRRMRKVKLSINGTLISLGIGTAGLIGWSIFKKDPKKVEDQGNLTDQEFHKWNRLNKEIEQSLIRLGNKSVEIDGKTIDAMKPKSDSDEDKATYKEEYEKEEKHYNRLVAHHDVLAARRKKPKKAEEASTMSWVIGMPVKLGLALGIAGLILTSGQHVLRVVSGTLEEALNLWWRGYGYWYNSLEQRIRSTYNGLRERLQQARKIAQSGFDSNALTRQIRRSGSSQNASTHYRADITTDYQLGLGWLERAIALMYIMAPQDNHTVIYRHVSKIAADMGRFAESLQKDLNENTHGSLTDYSDKTLELCSQVVENIQIFLTTYRVYLRK